MLQKANLREALLLIGTVSGNVFALDVNTLELSEYIVFEDSILQRIPESAKREKYPVDLLSVCPTNPRLTLMVFDHRLLLSYDSSTNEVLGTSVFEVQCKNITWTRDGSECVVALHDGSYASCDPARASIIERPAQVFGPFPCIPTKKACFAETSSSSEKIVLFSGGMPHASYGDRFVVTARQGDRTCVFDFASPVIDFLLTRGGSDAMRSNRRYSSAAWPLNATIPVSDEGRIVKEATKRQLYLTGHENGTVRVWSAGHAVMNLLFVIDTRNEFAGFSDEAKDTLEAEQPCDSDTSDDEFQITGDWPPFKKVGEYDPFCDDAGLSVQRLAFDEKSGHIVVGGRAGHVLLYTLEEVEREMTPQMLKIELCEASKLSMPARNSKPLTVRTNALKYTPGYQPCPLSAQDKCMLVQLQPPQPVSAVAVLSARNLIAASNEYGFALIDIQRQTVLLQNTLVNQAEAFL
ncbi:unnamed protein product [Strongylus vulgaris]|uniref:Lethal giant larvae homologue 2 domain-containing protein n=1 Tax=Strongylus vulgaris TaxID=40348 RepID=A0A3P7LAN5_STRVU|nr:unnamed protein product [Strongylus vulgaris]